MLFFILRLACSYASSVYHINYCTPRTVGVTAMPACVLQAETLKENCVSFGMPAPRLEGVDAIEEDLSTTESSWALFKEYSSELKVCPPAMCHTTRSGGEVMQSMFYVGCC